MLHHIKYFLNFLPSEFYGLNSKKNNNRGLNFSDRELLLLFFIYSKFEKEPKIVIKLNLQKTFIKYLNANLYFFYILIT